MKAMMNALLNVRSGPRPDPLPDRGYDAWAVHAPYMACFLAVLLAALLMSGRDFGLLACGAALGAIAMYGVQRELSRGCQAAYYGSGLLAIALFTGAQGAGAYALPAGIFLSLALGVRAAATFFTPSVAPLAGRVPWRFEDVYRRQAKHFGFGGVAASLVLVAFSPTPVLKVLGIAALPLSLRTYSGQLLSPDARSKLWAVVAAFQGVALLVLVPSQGPLAAAWLVVASETILFVGTALIIAERTGVNAYSREKVAAGIGAGLLLVTLALPGSTILYVVLALVLGALVALICMPRRAPRSNG